MLNWPVFWSSDANSWLIGKVPDAGKDWGQEKRMTEDEMAGWHHWWNRHELGQTLGDGKGQRGLVCCCPWGRKESDTTGGLNNNSWVATVCWALLHSWGCSSEHNRQDFCSVTCNIQEWGEDRKIIRGHDNLNKRKLDDKTNRLRGNYFRCCGQEWHFLKRRDLNYDQTVTKELTVQRSGCRGVLA